MPIVAVIIALVVGAVAVFFFFPSSDEQSPSAVETEPKIELTVSDLELPSEPTEAYTYIDGTYTADAEYYTPKRVKHVISVTLEIQDDAISSADVRYDGADARTPSHLNFDGAYRPVTVGVAVDDLDLSRVGGASLTTVAFNEALTDIISDASVR